MAEVKTGGGYTLTMRFSDAEIIAIRAHYGESADEFDADLEADLRDDGPEREDQLDDRRRYRQLLKLWAGRRSPGRGRGDVHTEHCCEIHGCKYGDEKCTVLTRAATQSDLCETCEGDMCVLRFQEPVAEAYARSVAFMDLELGNYVLVDGERLRFAKLPTATENKAQYADLVWAIRTAYLAGVIR